MSISERDSIDIQQVLHRYCRSMDRMDAELALSCFEPDADLSYGSLYRGTPSGFVEWLWPVHAAMIGHSHAVSNILISENSDGTCASETYVQVTLRAQDDEGKFDLVSKGRYLDRWKKRDNVWRICERMYVSDLSTVIPVGERSLSGVLKPNASQNRQPSAARNTTDPSYAMFAGGSPHDVCTPQH